MKQRDGNCRRANQPDKLQPMIHFNSSYSLCRAILEIFAGNIDMLDGRSKLSTPQKNRVSQLYLLAPAEIRRLGCWPMLRGLAQFVDRLHPALHMKFFVDFMQIPADRA
jgi:hypothetical protein